MQQKKWGSGLLFDVYAILDGTPLADIVDAFVRQGTKEHSGILKSYGRTATSILCMILHAWQIILNLRLAT